MEQLRPLDLTHIAALHSAAITAQNQQQSPLQSLGNTAQLFNTSMGQRLKWQTAAYEAMRTGKVGVVLLAGGQGTRLGFDRPKGEYVIAGLPSVP